MAEMPNLSCRMNEVTAAVMRPLIKNLPQRVEDYNRRYDSVVKVLREEAGDIIVVPTQDERVGTVGDHLNFYLTGVTDEQNALFRQTCVAMGVPVSWFQSQVNARWHVNWRKYGSPTFDLPNTDEVLRFAYDLKMPPYFDDADFPAFARVIARAARVAAGDDGPERARAVPEGILSSCRPLADPLSATPPRASLRTTLPFRSQICAGSRGAVRDGFFLSSFCWPALR